MNDIVSLINNKLSDSFPDYRGLYFYGSRKEKTHSDDSDYDLVLIFDSSDYKKKLDIAGIIGRVEYEYNVYIDVKIMTSEGDESPESIRKNVNPVFISQAIDNGIFYVRQH